jgi:hypothetical protein
MGRRQGPAAARDGMKRLIALLLCLQIAGCAHSVATVSTSTAATSGGVAAGSTAVGAQVTAASSGAGAIALFAAAAAMMMTASSESASGTTTYNANPFAAMDSTSRRPPELDASRRVHEQDCTKPILDWSANLKCR